MQNVTHFEEKTTVIQDTTAPVVADTHVHHHDTVHTDKTKTKTKTKKNRKVKEEHYGPKKSVGTKIKEFFTGRKDEGIIYQNGLPIAGLNGPIVQPMGAPIRQPAEIHPVATINTAPVRTGHIDSHHTQGPVTTTYGPAPPLAPGLPEGYTKTTTVTEVHQPGAEFVQPMNAIAQPIGLGAVVQPAGVIIAKHDKATRGIKDGYLKDQRIRDFPHDKVKDKPLRNEYREEVHTNTTDSYVAPTTFVEQVPIDPAPVIFTGPARVLEEKHMKEKHTEKDKHKHDKHGDKHLYEEAHHTHVDTVNTRPNAVYQPTVLEQQPMPVTVMQQGYVQQQQPMVDTHIHEREQIRTGGHQVADYHHDTHIHNDRLPAQQNFGQMPPMGQNQAIVREPGFISQQPGMAPSNQPLVRNHQQVPMVSQSGLQQGGIFQNDTARPVQTFTPVVQQNQTLTEAPIMNQAAMEQQMYAPSGIRTKEGLVHTHGVATGQQQQYPVTQTTTKHHPAVVEERKETIVHKDVKY